MIIFEKFKNMTIDELSNWINENCVFDDAPWFKWWDKNYCLKCEPEIVDDPDTGREFCNAYCELHDNCKYFPEKDYIPTIEDSIKMWLESEEED